MAKIQIVGFYSTALNDLTNDCNSSLLFLKSANIKGRPCVSGKIRKQQVLAHILADIDNMRQILTKWLIGN